MPDLSSVARWLILAGLALALVGGFLWILGRSGLPVGRLPGDIRFSAGHVTCFVPLASSIVLSILLTVLINLVIRLLNK